MKKVLVKKVLVGFSFLALVSFSLSGFGETPVIEVEDSSVETFKPYFKPLTTVPFSATVPAAPEEPAMGPHVTIDTRSCHSVESTPTIDYIDYQEDRYCHIIIPQGATIRKITAYMPPRTDFRHGLLDFLSTNSQLFLKTETVQSGEYRSHSAMCRTGPTNPDRIIMSEAKKTFDCSSAVPMNSDTSIYIQISSRGKARFGFKEVIQESRHIIFPILGILQIEYDEGS